MKIKLILLYHFLGLLLAKISSVASAQGVDSSPMPDTNQVILKDGELLIEGIGKEFILNNEDTASINNFIDATDPNKSVHGINEHSNPPPVLPPGY